MVFTVNAAAADAAAAAAALVCCQHSRTGCPEKRTCGVRGSAAAVMTPTMRTRRTAATPSFWMHRHRLVQTTIIISRRRS